MKRIRLVDKNFFHLSTLEKCIYGSVAKTVVRVNDLSKASNLLNAITKSRNAKILARLRQKEVLDRLIEIARWRSHAKPARYIPGRIPAGSDERRLAQLIMNG